MFLTMYHTIHTIWSHTLRESMFDVPHYIHATYSALKEFHTIHIAIDGTI